MKITNIKALIVSLLLVLSLVLGAGCDLISITEISPSGPPTTANLTPAKSEETTTPPANQGAIDSEWTVPSSEGQGQFLPNIADVVARVKPSVVAINTEILTRDYFNQPATQEGAGSGWIISEDGIIVTNNHVIEEARSISVTLDDGRTFSADLDTVATDPLTDLAVFKIDAENLPAVQVGDSSKMRVGDWVVAIGNSLGEGIRATQGIVSRQNVSVPVDQTQVLYGLIETDAAINPGNSGGPLVNLAGEVVGITSAKLAAVEVEATGFAISTEAAMPIIRQLINDGYAIHPWLGVSLYPMDQSVIEMFDLKIDRGAFISVVVADSPAGRAGLREEDVITGFAGREIGTVDDLIQVIRAANVGEEVEIVYVRGNETITTRATLVERP
ncbi:S1C family serine protease [Chloroflexota bacterium]